MNPVLEKPGLLPPNPGQPNADRRRPADVYIPSWPDGAPACLDLAVTSPFRADVLEASSAQAGAAAIRYEEFKRTYLDTAAHCVAQGMSFRPMVAEPTGGWGPSAVNVLKVLARSQATRTGEDYSVVLADQYSRLSAAVRKCNARAILRRSVPTPAATRASAARAAALAVLAED